jgi:hypothetical protein
MSRGLPPNSEQSYKGKVKTHNYINRQISQQPENCENRNDPDCLTHNCFHHFLYPPSNVQSMHQ